MFFRGGLRFRSCGSRLGHEATRNLTHKAIFPHGLCFAISKIQTPATLRKFGALDDPPCANNHIEDTWLKNNNWSDTLRDPASSKGLLANACSLSGIKCLRGLHGRLIRSIVVDHLNVKFKNRHADIQTFNFPSHVENG